MNRYILVFIAGYLLNASIWNYTYETGGAKHTVFLLVVCVLVILRSIFKGDKQ